MADAGQTIKLQSSDGEIFDVDIAIIKQSGVLKGFSDTAENSVIPLSNANSTILKKVIEWADYHKDDAPIIEDNEDGVQNRHDISAWDQNFIQVDQGSVFEIILAANYLEMKGLLDLACKTVAYMIKEKAPEEIRRIFNIKNNFTPEEEEQIQKDNKWCEEK